MSRMVAPVFMDWKRFRVFLMMVLVLVGLVSYRFDSVSAADSAINPAHTTSQNVKVLVVEINPHLNTIAGRPKAGDYLFGENIVQTAVNEQVEDLEWSSHGYLHYDVTYEYVDAFPRYKESFTLPDGSIGYAFNEANFLAATGNVGGGQGWWIMYEGCWFSGRPDCGLTTTSGVQAVDPPKEYSFDYNWFLYDLKFGSEGLNLIEKKNRGDFDEVWLASVDPAESYEIIMVGKNPYFTNGTPIVADCDNFVLGGASISRRDSQLHAYAHGIEGIMGGRDKGNPNGVYSVSYNMYGEIAEGEWSGRPRPTISVSTKEEYMALNPWERFMLNDAANSGTLNGVGTVHHPFNGVSGYDYDNNNSVNTTYLEWKNKSLEDMNGDYTSANQSLWNSAPYNSVSYKNSDRHYIRFWLSLFPHETGYTKDGYLKNWWKYVYSADYVSRIITNEKKYSAEAGDTLKLEYTLHFRSGRTEPGEITEPDSNIIISNPEVVGFEGGELKAKIRGESKVTMYRDGKSVEFEIVVTGLGKQEVSFSESDIKKTLGDSDFTNVATTTGDGIITYSSSNTSVAKVDSSTGKVTIVGAGEAIITASASATENYSAGSASYTLTVSERGTGGGGRSGNCLILNCDEGIVGILHLIINIMNVCVSIFAIIGILICGIQYTTSGGDEGKATKSKRRLFEIIIGLTFYVMLNLLADWLFPSV